MSEYLIVAEEIAKIDALLAQNYKFKSIIEDLEGASVTFICDKKQDEQCLHIKMADARKYFSSKLLEQLNNPA